MPQKGRGGVILYLAVLINLKEFERARKQVFGQTS